MATPAHYAAQLNTLIDAFDHVDCDVAIKNNAFEIIADHTGINADKLKTSYRRNNDYSFFFDAFEKTKTELIPLAWPIKKYSR